MPKPVLKVGNVEITALLDVEALVPCAAIFPQIAKEQWAAHAEYLAGDADQLPLSVTSFLLRSNGKTVLVDTGIGAKDRPGFPNGRLPDAISEAGIRADAIDIVLATHMHIDHVGWHTTAHGEGFVPTFSKATHVFNRAEWEYWTQPEIANAPANAHIVDSVLPLRDVAEIALVEGEHRVTDDVTMLQTPGHSPAHASFLIRSGGEAAVILGDIAHNPAQVTETNWAPIFDMDPALAARTREALMKRLEHERLLVAAGHFAHPGFGRVVLVEGKRYWRGL